MSKLWLIVLFFSIVESAKIMGIFHVPGKSHYILGEVLLRNLAEKGHEVTMVSPFPRKEPLPNWTDIDLVGFLDDMKEFEVFFKEVTKAFSLTGFFSLFNMTQHFTFKTLENKEIQHLIETKAEFDVIILDAFLSDAFFVLGHIFQAQVIVVASSGSSFFVNHIVGNHAPYAYVPAKALPFTDNMNFFQRVANTVMSVIGDLLQYYDRGHHEAYLKEHFPGSPSLNELTNDVALVLANGHYSFECPKPSVPNMIEIGGFHVEKPKALPQDLKKYLDGAQEGVIYFSLGSNVKSSDLPKEKVEEILRAFAKIPVKVLWKWETDDLPTRANNIKVGKWFPQNDILAHPNVKAFITHGGLLSSIEAVYHGVPVIGIPFFGDQYSNTVQTVSLGYGIFLPLIELTETTLIEALNEIVNNSKYRENIKVRSVLLKDQPIRPLDKAIFWIEHVIRNKGAPHLRTKMNELSLAQYLLLDVTLFITSIALLISVVSYYIIFKKLVKLFVKKQPVQKLKAK